MSNKYKNEYWREKIDKALQRAQLLTERDDFQADTVALRKRWKIPEKGFSDIVIYYESENKLVDDYEEYLKFRADVVKTGVSCSCLRVGRADESRAAMSAPQHSAE